MLTDEFSNPRGSMRRSATVKEVGMLQVTGALSNVPFIPPSPSLAASRHSVQLFDDKAQAASPLLPSN